MQQQKFINILFGLVLCGSMLVTRAEATQPTYSAGRRLALVFGNNQYSQLSNLVKAVNDAAAMARELTAAGFQVVNIDKYSDLDRRSMLDARDELMSELSAGDQVVVFYAGHGVQIGSEIYLMPVSFPLLRVASAERVAEESVTLQSIMDAVKKRIGADGFALYIVDACRNNPLPKTAKRSIPEMLHRGLVPMQPPAGQIAVYAASNGQEALDAINNDDSNPNGVFTRVLLKHIKKSGEPIMEVLAEVQEEVIQLAKQSIDENGNAHEQQPAIYNESRLRRPFCFYPNEYGCVKEASEVQLSAAELQREREQRERLEEENRQLREQMAAQKNKDDAVEVKQQPVQHQRQVFEPEMVDIPAGSFEMGSPSNEEDRDGDEGPVHTVHVKAFQMGKYEITRGQFRAFVNASGYKTEAETGDGCYGWTGSSWEKKPEFNWRNVGFEQNDKHPVVCVSWNDSQKYIEWLNNETGKNYRLPTEAEWEYAARAGTTTPFWTGDCISTDQANYDGNYDYNNCGAKTGVYRQKTMSVGSFEPNLWGLYDTLGNVWEWTCSEYTNTYDGNETTCKNRASESRVLRGGSWVNYPRYLRAAHRLRFTVDYRYVNGGVRLVRVF